MSQPELLKRVVQALTALGADYMVTGSVASSLQGEPRASHDIDLVVLLPPGVAGELAKAFPPPSYYLAEEAIQDALRHRSQFNLLSIDDGEKVDFWILTDDPFDKSRFVRKRVEEVFEARLNVSAPEDTILAKLRWAKMSGGSEKQLTDALRVYEIQRGILDLEYLNRWVTQLGVEDLWRQLLARAEPVQ